MRIAFLTLAYPLLEEDRNLYSDLFDEVSSRGHDVTVFRPDESRRGGGTSESWRGRVRIVSVPTGRITKTGRLSKAINTLLLSGRYRRAVDLFGGGAVDLLVYSTPPITFVRVIRTLRVQTSCATYLLLKDIFPQNAVDIGMIREGSLIHRFFRRKERRLYALSDRIGCMSPANVEYLLSHNPEIPAGFVHVNPNSIRPSPFPGISELNLSVLERYGIPPKALKLIYGGNLGKPQGIGFMLEVLEKLAARSDIHTVIVGSGTEYSVVEAFIRKKTLRNVTLLPTLPRDKYMSLLSTMDVGLIFLDSRFTIPNFPSRLLDYLDVGLPVIAATDGATDIGDIITMNGAGLHCPSNDPESFIACVEIMRNPERRHSAGRAARDLLEHRYTASLSANILLSSIK